VKILRLDLTAFGPFCGERLDLGDRPGALQLVYGPNEAGKSTTLRAISDVLFGIPERTPDAHRHAPAQLRVGALLESRSGARVEIVRRKGRKNTLLDADGSALDDATLSPLLQGATRELFEGLFGLDHVRLRESAEALLAGKGNVGEGLFAAGVGGRGVHRLSVELAQEADELFVARARERKVSKAIAEVKEARDDLRNAATSPTKYLEQERALSEAIRGREALRARRTEVSAEQARLTRAVTVLPGLRRRQELFDRLAALGHVVDVPPASAAQRAEALRDIAEAEREAARDEERARSVRERLSHLVVSEALLEVDDAVLADLRDRRGSHLSAHLDRPKLVSNAQALEAAVERSLAAIGARRTASSLQLSVAGAAKIRALAVRRQRLEDRLGDARKRLDDACARQTHLVSRLLAAAPGDAQSHLRPALGRLSEMVAPSPEVVEQFAARYAELDGDRSRLERTEEQARRRVRDVERKLFALRREGDVPTESDLRAARGRRESLWRELKGALSSPLEAEQSRIADYESSTESADTIADRLRREADRVALLASLESEERAAREEAGDARGALERQAARAAALEEEWRGAWTTVGMEPRSPVEMKSWSRELGAATELEPEVARLQAEVERGSEELSAWRAAWSEASGLLGLGGEPTDEEAFAVLDAMAQHVRQVEQAEGLRRRIEGIDRDAARFAEDVEERCKRYAPDLAALPVAEAAERLVRAAEKARIDRAERDRLEAELAALTRSKEALALRRKDAEARLAALVTAARVSAPEELEQAERRSRDAALLRQQIETVESELLAAGDGAAVEVLDEETRGLDLDRARARLRDLEAELDELAEKMVQASEDAGHLDHGVHSMANTNAADAAALLEARVATLKRHVRRYVRVRLASVLLAREIEQYRQENQGPVLARASELLPRLTLGRYSGLRVGLGDGDESVLLAVRADGGESVGVAGLSDGTRDQLYLALRLASLERYCRLNEPMPLVLDDVLIHSDDARAEAALRVLGEVAETTQVLFFTHNARLVELARSALRERLVVHHVPTAVRFGDSGD
jgi:uncharacterized protein YhaN